MKVWNFQFCFFKFLIVLIPSILYFPNIFSDFVYDDRPAIVTNPDVTLTNSFWSSAWYRHDFWGTPIQNSGSHKSWRPFTTFTYRLQWALHGSNPQLFHIFNILIHILNCLMVQKLAKFSLKPSYATSSAIMFAVHPINTEAVCSLVGRADLLSTFWMLIAVLTHRKYNNQRLLILIAVLGIFSKETSIVILPLLILLQFLKAQKFEKIWKNVGEMLISFTIIIYFRLSINNFQSPKFSKFDNPIAYDPDFKVRLLTFLYLPFFHFSLISFPLKLSFDWSMNSIPPITTVFDQRVAQFLIFYALLLIIFGILFQKIFLSHRTQKNDQNLEIFWLLCLLTVPHLISSNLFAYVGFVAAERILYLPNVSFCILVTYSIEFLSESVHSKLLHKFTRLLILTTFLLYITQSTRRIISWQTEEALFQSAISTSPAKAHANLGHIYFQKNDIQIAKSHYLKALKYQPSMSDTWYNLGILLSASSKNKSEAISAYNQALKYRSTFAAAHLNLGLLLWSSGNQKSAIAHLEKCWNLTGLTVKSYQNHLNIKMTCALNLGRFYQKLNSHQKTIQILKEALHINSYIFEHRPTMLNTIGMSYEKIGLIEEAESYYQSAIRLDHNHIDSFVTMAQLKQRQNQSIEAKQLLETALGIAPTSSIVLRSIAWIAHQQGNSRRSQEFYQRAISIDPTNRQTLHSFATMLRQSGRSDEAEKYFQQIVQISSESFEAHADYGAILHSNRKYSKALIEYNRALELRPDDVVTIDNRQKLIRILEKDNNL